jgi:hypothetical protein
MEAKTHGVALPIGFTLEGPFAILGNSGMYTFDKFMHWFTVTSDKLHLVNMTSFSCKTICTSARNYISAILPRFFTENKFKGHVYALDVCLKIFFYVISLTFHQSFFSPQHTVCITAAVMPNDDQDEQGKICKHGWAMRIFYGQGVCTRELATT